MNGTLDPAGLRRAMEIFLQGLREHREEINSINVFPVPDADTGTNLVLTQEAVVRALGDADPATEGFGGLAARISEGSLMGARGNAGAILAQVLRALAEGLPGGPARAAASADLAAALERAGVEAARAVARPVEGTALTVVRDAAEAAAAAVARGDTLTALAVGTVAAARASLARTRDTNPALRRAGVVDAGGKGIVLLLDALRASIEGTGLTEPAGTLGPARATGAGQVPGEQVAGAAPDGVYEVQFLVETDEAGGADLRDALAALGESVVVAGGAGLSRAHVHTPRPGPAVEAGLAHGRIRDLSIVYLGDGGSAEVDAPTPSAMVALGESPGVARVLSSLGAVVVPWDGGEPPSEERVVEAIRSAPAGGVLVVPGHPAAEAAAVRATARLADRARVVGSARSAPAAIAAATVFNPAEDTERNAAAMDAAAAACRDGGVTRTAAGVWVGRANGEDVAAGRDASATMVALARRLDAEHADVLTVIAGEGVPPADRDAMTSALRAAFPHATVDVVDGGPRGSPFLIGVE